MLLATGMSCCRASAVAQGRFAAAEQRVRTFAWDATAWTVEEALNQTFPGKDGWVDLHYRETNTSVTWEGLTGWIDEELLGGPDPFAEHGGRVPLPWPAGEEATMDQLAQGQWVAYSRRQVCYIVAKSLLGAGTRGYANGLLRLLDKKPEWGNCTPRTAEFGRAFFSLLAACAADPGLANGAQGPVLIAAKAEPPQEMDAIRNASRGAAMANAGLRVCQYDDGLPVGTLSGLPHVPPEGCRQPSADKPGRDFMTGGQERLAGQAIQDISAAFIGGYIYGNACGLGGGQDERLLVYMPEVAALTFFLSEAPDHPQLRVPAWVLGARMLFYGLDGTGRFDQQLRHDPDMPLRSDLVEVSLAEKTYAISSSRPFLAFMSETQGFLGDPESEHGPDVRLARRNKHPLQREANASSWFAFEKQVRAWYTGVALTSYNADVRPALRRLVRSVGTGPWLAGLWWGDSQLGFLASWLGQAIAAQTWNDTTLPLEYYIYSAFTESPGNQCFVHSRENCRACMLQCVEKPLPASAYWLPEWAYMRTGNASSCAGFIEDCGEMGLEHVVAEYTPTSAGALWRAVETALRRGGTDRSVFDELLRPGAASLRGTGSSR